MSFSVLEMMGFVLSSLPLNNYIVECVTMEGQYIVTLFPSTYEDKYFL